MLRIEGGPHGVREVGFEELIATAGGGDLVDVARVDPRRTGEAVPLGMLLDALGVSSPAGRIAFHAADGYAVDVSLAAVRDRGLLVVAVGGRPLPAGQGGPVRFLVPDAADCGLAEVDTCANVKNIVRIVLVDDDLPESGHGA